MPEDQQSRLLEVVGEVDERAGGPRVGHQQQHLRPPELDVLLADVQHEQVLAHLGVGGGCDGRDGE